MIGGLIVMTFFGSSSTGGATSEACPSVDETTAPSATGAGAGGGGSTTGGGGGAVSPGFATSFEIGGKIVVLTFGTLSADFALGLAINDTDSILLTDVVVSSVVSGTSPVTRALAPVAFAAP